MKNIGILIPVLFLFLFIFNGCGNGENKTTSSSNTDSVKNTTASTSEYAKGEAVYKTTCFACHQPNGLGIPNAFPPLANSDYLLADKTRAIKQIITGSSGEITVNGNKFIGVMPPQALNDQQIADVLNYVLHSWGNDGGTVTPEEVKSLR